VRKGERERERERKSLGYRGCVRFREQEHQHLEDISYMQNFNDPLATKKIPCLDNTQKKYTSTSV